MTYSKFHSGKGTDTGQVRTHNEDNFHCDDAQGLWIVADGMGGHEGGEIASAITTDTLSQAFASGCSLEDSIQQCHQAVMQAAQDGTGKHGMGSTVVALSTDEDAYRVAWVGDSRAYFWNGEQLSQITRDHSYVQQLIDNGLITEEDARYHPNRNVITRAIGLNNNHGQFKVDSLKGKLAPGEGILLCTDGLSGEVSIEEMELIVQSSLNKGCQTVVDELIQAALEHGGHDNVAAIFVQLEPDTHSKHATLNWSNVLISIAFGILLLGLLFFVLAS